MKSDDVISELQDAFIPELYLVLDTNVLIDYLDVMKRFNEDIERLSLPITIIIPNVLLSELDGCVLCSVTTSRCRELLFVV